MPGTRCFHIGPERDENLFDGLEVDRVGNVADADFIFNTGPRLRPPRGSMSPARGRTSTEMIEGYTIAVLG